MARATSKAGSAVATKSRNADGVSEGDGARWAAVLARDKSYDETFYYSVATTGVYCRPSCPARRPKRENVQFHATCAGAEAAGFRPCKRCRPDAPALDAVHAAKIAVACRAIESAEEPLRLADLAGAAGLSPFHFHRIFKAATGVTPKAYAMQVRGERVRETLARGATVTDAIYGSGFNSATRFYESANELLGMTPGRYRAGGRDMTIRFAVGQCSLGRVLVAASEAGVCAILLGDDEETLRAELARRFPKAQICAGDNAFGEVLDTVIAHVEAPETMLKLPLDVRGTAFQQRVWAALREIPAGSTATYSQVASRIGKPRSVRAVAGACAANPLAVAIPCHRVVASDGRLSGYRWGIKRKRLLLDREGK